VNKLAHAATSKPTEPISSRKASKPSPPLLGNAVAAKIAEDIRKQDAIREQARLLHKKLHGNGRDGSRSPGTGTSFQKLCKLGFDPEWLEWELVRLQNRPAKSHKVYRKQDEAIRRTASRRLRLVARDLETLGTSRHPPFVADHVVVSFTSPTTSVEGDIPLILREIANCIEDDHTLPGFEVENGARHYILALPDQIAHLISEVRRRTSDHKPHLDLLADLIQAATGKTHSVASLNMLDIHAKSRRTT
jgi:hypothetical protein